MNRTVPSAAVHGFHQFGPWTIALTLLVLLVAAVGGCFAYARLTATTTGDIRRLVSENLPLGSSSDDIERFLDAEGIDHGPVQRLADFDYDREFDYPPETIVIKALVRDTANYFTTTADIVIVFFLDNELRLVGYDVFEIYSSI